MKYILSFFLAVSLFPPQTSLACCAENIYQLFPIGESNNEILFIEVSIKRNCGRIDAKKSKTGFTLKGEINLVKSTDDSMVFVAKIDSIDVVECECRPTDQYEKSAYEAVLKTSYLRGIKLAKQLDGFKRARTKAISFNDTTNLTKIEEVTDSTYSRVFNYKNIIVSRFGLKDVVSCFPDKLVEIRQYETNNYTITVFRLRCQYLEEEVLSRQTKRFNNLKTAFWKEKAHWHGTSKDFFYITRK